MADNNADAAGQNANPPGISDPLSNRETDTGNLEKLDDTRTRKTIKLRPIASGTPAKYADAAAAPAEGEEVTDPLNQRHTNTGNLEKLDDTRTRKTIKMTPGGAAKPEVGTSDAEAKTIELKPIKTEAPAPAPVAEEVETATVPVTKAKPTGGGLPNLIPDEDKIQITPGPLKAVEDDKTRIMRPPVKTPLQAPASAPAVTPKPASAAPAAEPVVPTSSGPMDADDTRTRKTIKISPAPKSSVLEAAESVMPSVAQAKALPPGQTIKLRPSESGSAAPAPVAPQSTAKDTIKLKPGAGASAAAPPAAAPAPSAAPAPASAPPSASTVALKPAAPAKPAAPSVPLKPAAPSAVNPGAATGAKFGLKPAAPASVPPAATNPPPVSASGTGEKKKGGLSLKKDESGGPKGPPAAEKEAEIMGDKDKKGRRKKPGGGAEGPSMFYTVSGFFTFMFLFASAYISTAHYINTWEQARFEEPVRITVPFLEDRINMR